MPAWRLPEVKAEHAFVFALAAARLLFCCYRAKHQAITIDEASTYLAYLDGSWRLLGSQYDANNHVLFTILAKLSISVLGLSEFALRLPGLIAGFFLIVGTFKMLRPIRSSVLRWAALAVVCLHPLLLDFSILARGYGLAVALLVWAICFVMDGRLIGAGLLLGLAAAANLSVAFPVTALIAATALSKEIPWARVAWKTALSALLVFCSICAIPMRLAERSNFYLGSSDLSQTLFGIVQSSISVGVKTGFFGTIDGARWIAAYVLPILAVIAAIGTFRPPSDSASRTRLIPFTVLAITVLEIVLAHWWFNLPYPTDRTALYMIPLAAAAWAVAGDASRNKISRVVWALPMLIAIAQFITQLQTRYFITWPFNADDRKIAELLRGRTEGLPEGSVSVSTSWPDQPGLEFYRKYLHILSLKQIERHDPAPLSGYDYYVLDGAFDRGPELKVLFVDHFPGWYSVTVGVP